MAEEFHPNVLSGKVGSTVTDQLHRHKHSLEIVNIEHTRRKVELT